MLFGRQTWLYLVTTAMRKAQNITTYRNAVLLPVLSPVMACVTEHEAVVSHPVRTAVSALCSDSCDLRPFPKIDLQPLMFDGVDR